MLEEEQRALTEVRAKNYELALHLELVEDNTSYLTTSLEKVIQQFLLSSKSGESELEKVCQGLEENMLSKQEIIAVEKSIEELRRAFNEKVKALTLSRQQEEAKLDREYEEEQQSFALVLTCVDALEKKNAEIRDTKYSSDGNNRSSTSIQQHLDVRSREEHNQGVREAADPTNKLEFQSSYFNQKQTPNQSYISHTIMTKTITEVNRYLKFSLN